MKINLFSLIFIIKTNNKLEFWFCLFLPSSFHSFIHYFLIPFFLIFFYSSLLPPFITLFFLFIVRQAPGSRACQPPTGTNPPWVHSCRRPSGTVVRSTLPPHRTRPNDRPSPGTAPASDGPPKPQPSNTNTNPDNNPRNPKSVTWKPPQWPVQPPSQ